jgi:small-conductance mechanosensitive channel
MPTQLDAWLQAFSTYGWSDLGWSLGVLVIGWTIGRLAAEVFYRALSRWATTTDTTVDDTIAQHMKQPKKWLLPLLGIYVVFPLVTLPEGMLGWLRHALLIAVIVGAGWAASRAVQVIEAVVRQRLDATAEDNLRARQLYTQTRGLRNILVFLITVLTFGAVLITFDQVRQLGAGLMASAGVAGIVVGFAAQRSIATVVAGIQIAIAQPIRVDDVVIVEGEWGWIEEITLTYVVVRIWDLRRLVVPITYFIEKPFQNWTRVSADLLGAVELYLDYSVPVDELRAKLTEILEASEYWDGKVNNIQVTGTTEHAMVVRPLFSARNSGNQWNLRCEVREKLIAFIADKYPHALPRIRASVHSLPES